MIRFLRKYQSSLRSSRWTRNRIARIQQQRFRRLLHHAFDHSEFYHELYRGIDLDHCPITDIPIVTKSVMMDHFDRLVTDKRLKLGEIQEWIARKSNYGKLYLDEYLPIPTSGSSGEYALVVYHRQALDLIQSGLFARHPLHPAHAGFGQTRSLVSQLLGRKTRIAVIAVPYGTIGGMVKTVPAFHRLFAQVKFISLFDPIEQIVSTLNNFQPDGLISMSFFLSILAQEQLAGNLNLSFRGPVAYVAGGGEPLTDHTQELAREAWNMAVQDDYGAVECYFMAASCDKNGSLHAMSDLCILEAVDGANNPVPPGTYGEKVLVTNLAGFVQPIIRYEIDDIVGYTDKSCDCGLPFPTLLPVQGRLSDFIYFEKPNGEYERFHPYRFRIPLFYATDIRQYQIVQTARNALTFNYVPQAEDDGIEPKIKQTLKTALERASLQSRVSVTLKRLETISRDKRSGKYMIIKSLGAPVNLDGRLDKKTY